MLPPNGLLRSRPRAGLARPGALLRCSELQPPRANSAALGRLGPVRQPNPIQRTTGISRPTVGRSEFSENAAPEEIVYLSVLYTKRSKKKRKSWLDGYVVVKRDRHVELQNEDGKKIAAESCKPLGGLREGNTLEIGSYELEVQNPVKEDDYISGRLFAKPSVQAAPLLSANRIGNGSTKRTSFKPLRPKHSTDGHVNGHIGPMHDPNAPDACVLLPAVSGGIPGISTVAVVLDPFLSKQMRPHQKEGVKFLYKCVQASFYLSNEGGQGAILADEMGLGKSLQAIALLWTLLKQSPKGPPLVQKAVIVCPASLVQNWVSEVKKWLGFDRLKPVEVASGSSTFEAKEALAAFINGTVRRLLIISYEMFRSHADQLYKSNIGVVVCDEGHRLKSSQGNKTIEALRKLPCRRRVILTGTPVQNDLEEFFAVCDFVNPGCLNTLTSFRSVFANPIISSRDSNANYSVVRVGEARARELGKITSAFVLRRASSILAKYLPPKQEVAIFCRLRPKQEREYQKEAKDRLFDVSSRRRFCAALSAINFLRKICCHPALVVCNDRMLDSVDEEDGAEEFDDTERPVIKASDISEKDFHVADSTKMQITLSLCICSLQVGDKVILVSNYTSTLDLLQVALSQKSITYCRLDGKTAVGQRGDIVRRFNEGSMGDVFLLSAKAGGVGLNLIGANRLILFDPDWNPATDLQAMARVWRDGQTKAVFVYRLLCTGTIEEKIFQRQLFKGELQSAVDGEQKSDDQPGKHLLGSKEGNFSAEELRDLFQYDPNHTYCDTLEVLERSQEESLLVNERDGLRPAALLDQFRAYKDLFEAEQGIRGEVFCADDQVLHKTLNCDEETHDLVSYLYTKRADDSSPLTGKPALFSHANRGTSSNTDVRKRKRERKSMFVDDSDEEKTSSDEDEEIKVILGMRHQLSTASSASLADDVTVDRRSGEQFSNSAATECPRKRSRNGTGQVKEETKAEPVITSPVANEIKTWDDALKDLETDAF